MPHVLPQPCCELAWVVADLGDLFCEQVVGYLVGHWDSIHPADNLLVDPAVCDYLGEIVGSIISCGIILKGRRIYSGRSIGVCPSRC